MKKRVFILNHYAGSMFFDQGGRHYGFAKYLRRSGYEPVVFCCNAKHGAPETYFQEDGLWHEHLAGEIGTPFVFVRGRTYTGNGKQRVLNMADFYRGVQRAAREYAALHGAPDVVYASSVHPLTLLAGLHLAKRFGVECVCEVRDLWPESIVAYSDRFSKSDPLIRLLYRGERWLYRRADRLIFTMEGAYGYILEQGWERDVPQSKVRCINNGVDLESFRANRERFRLDDPDLDDPDVFTVVYVGAVRLANNLGALLDAAKEVRDPAVRFLIWGAGDETEALQKRAREERIGNVVFKGRVQKQYIPSIVSRADVNLVHGGHRTDPLFRFGVSMNKIFDCLAAGRPVLMDLPAKYNPVKEWGAGICVPGAEAVPEGLTKIRSLGREDRDRMSANALRAAEAYDYRTLTGALIKVIEGEGSCNSST